MRFDAYHGNLWEGRFDHLAGFLAQKVGARVERGRPRGRHGAVLEVLEGAAPIGWVADDPVNQTVYFEFKGPRTPDVVEVIRSSFDPQLHNVARADVCEDFDHPGAYRELVHLVDECKGDARVHSESITPRDGDRGETTYWGSTKSAYRVRCYEKGKQAENLHLERPHWARIELQCRPAKSLHKALAAQLPPHHFWGFGGWTTRIGESVTGLELPRFIAPQEPATFERTMLYVGTAFRRFFQTALEDYGSWECVGRELEAIWAHQDEMAKRGPGR